jgi:hypothetical protein
VSFVKELLLLDGGGWDKVKLNELFFEGDVTDILNFPVGRGAWNYTKNWMFTIKSAYHFKMQLRGQNTHQVCCSLSSDENRGCLAL